MSERVVDIFDAVGLDKPNIGLLDEEFLAQVQKLPEKNLAVELLERLLEGEIKSRFASNVVQDRKFSEMLASVIARYQNRSIETAQVMEELVDMAKKFREAAARGETLGLSEDEVRFYDALVNNESAVRELTDETLKKIAHELTENLRQNLGVDWSERESVRARLRLMVKRILRKYKYPPDLQDAAVELVLLMSSTAIKSALTSERLRFSLRIKARAVLTCSRTMRINSWPLGPGVTIGNANPSKVTSFGLIPKSGIFSQLSGSCWSTAHAAERSFAFIAFPVSHLKRKPAPPGQGVPVFTIGDQPIARRGLKLFFYFAAVRSWITSAPMRSLSR